MKMRNRKTESGLTVNAVGGTHVILLGLNLSDQKRTGCLGFAIQRDDHTEDERYWLKGMKTFKATDPILGPGGEVSSREHPFQTFQWSDYSAKPDHSYTYRIVPLYGAPENLTEGDAVSIDISTESEDGDKHSVFFNRGAIASQEYARRFLNKSPDKIGEAAYHWLSRGLFEAFKSFVGRANSPHFGLYGAVYEFEWPDALKAIKAASDTGATVRILYDAIPGATGPLRNNQLAVSAASLESLCIQRTKGKIMHNKFFVLTKDNKPIAVWTGSTNLTENGIFGHSNCAHVIEDADVAAAYLAYWNELISNPENDAERLWVSQNNPMPPDPWTNDLDQAFSPRSGLNLLQWYADIADAPQKPIFMTFAFGMHKYFQKVYEKKDGVLRIALMEKEGNGAGLKKGKADIRRIRFLPNVVVAVGNNITTNSFDRWLKERAKLSKEANVRYIHTKYMLVDPLSDNPITITGSANFSEASTNANNENMVVIRNNQRVADIYLGEFLRLYSHYAFREAVTWDEEKKKKANVVDTGWQPNYLLPDDSWQADYYKKGHQRYLRRLYFSGSDK
jgi:phosphatidylserine/phosphatidylglycerophosphate/cardiolipin synthase-like enzyme